MNIKIIKESNGFTANLAGRLQDDKRHTAIQFWAKTEKAAREKLEMWMKINHPEYV